MTKLMQKPAIVDAIIWTGQNLDEVRKFVGSHDAEYDELYGLVIHTLEGAHGASVGDYIIRGINGDFYPCKPDIFLQTYDAA